MRLHRCIYVSSARIDPQHRSVEFARIVDHAKIANAEMGVTGALIYDGTRFAQLLEGPEHVVAALANRISIDLRHENVVILERKQASQRIFEHFAMVYEGRSIYIERTIAQTLSPDAQLSHSALEILIQLMQEFSR